MKEKNIELQLGLKRMMRQYAEVIVGAIIVSITLKVFILSAYKVPNSAMSPSLLPGDFLFAVKWPYSVNGKPFSFVSPNELDIRRGSLMVFSCPDKKGQSCIKRLVGLPGDRIEIVAGKFMINGKVPRFEEALALSTESREVTMDPLVVPPGHFYALSDRRDNKKDSRTWGAIPLRSLEAKAWFIWFSIGYRNNSKRIIRWDRILKEII